MEFEHPYIVLLAIPLLLILLRARRKSSVLLALSRTLIILLVLLALASPYTLERSTIERNVSITVLVDNSSSMALYPEELSDFLALGWENVNFVSSGNRSALGDAVLQSVNKGESVLLFTDGKNNYGRDLVDVVLIASRLNASIHAVELRPERGDVGVEVVGDKKVLIDVSNTYRVIVRQVGNGTTYTLRVSADDLPVMEQEVTSGEPIKEFTFTKSFNTEGPHKIQAEVVPKEDQFLENNVYYKAVQVLSRPKLLLVADRTSPLSTLLRELYTLQVSQAVEGLANYDAVLLDNQDIERLSPKDVEALREYISQGNGLVVVGGEESFERGGYRASLLETLLPVRLGEPPGEEEKLALVIAIDVSGSTQGLYGSTSKVDLEKAIATRIIRDLSPEDYFGVLAFDAEAHVLTPFGQHRDRQETEEKIARLQFGGGTIVYTAQVAADQMLKGFSGSKNLVIISDGVTNFPEVSFQRARGMADDGIKTYAVGVGEDTDEVFMSLVANIGRGVYYKPEEYQRLRLVFKREDKEKEKKEGIYSLVVENPSHFITQGLDLKASVGGFNDATPKSSAQALVSTSGGKPVLTVWRFGLGRVAAFTTDDGTKWSSQVYTDANAKLISAMANWAIGDPERRREGRIEATDVSLGDEVEVVVASKKTPQLAVDGALLRISGVDVDRYVATFRPSSPGFHQVSSDGRAELLAVNYPKEFRDLGFDETLLGITRTSGGSVHPISQGLPESVRQLERARTREESVQKAELSIYFILAALLLFFIEVAARRVKEILRMRRLEE
ncbi:MAG: VWA domain-containing protein [Candidatus Hydrothermarchaeota archaeon]